jgi:methylated-DNA-[protein]-cysteine S-methyltransferase
MTFDLPITYSGTPFQVKAWETLMRVPYGETWSYRDQAIEL